MCTGGLGKQEGSNVWAVRDTPTNEHGTRREVLARICLVFLLSEMMMMMDAARPCVCLSDSLHDGPTRLTAFFLLLALPTLAPTMPPLLCLFC